MSMRWATPRPRVTPKHCWFVGLFTLSIVVAVLCGWYGWPAWVAAIPFAFMMLGFTIEWKEDNTR